MIYLRIFLPLFFLVYFLLAFLMYAPEHRPIPGKHKVARNLNQLIWILLALLATVFSLYPEYYDRYILPLDNLIHPVINWSGFVLMLLAFTLALAAKNQHRLHKDEEVKGWLLVKDGIYSRTRNPFHMAQVITFVGFFMVAPSLWSIMLVVVGSIVVFFRIGLEEKTLESVFGEDYKAYEKKVPRWL